MSHTIKNFLQKNLGSVGRGRHRMAGDQARDARDWLVAEREYRLHLASVPGDQAIWIQYGHSFKEQGKLEEAEAAYQRAVELVPEDPDAQLQLGHVLKLMNRPDLAGTAYRKSFELKPSKAAFDEMTSISNTIDVHDLTLPHVSSVDADTIYLEVDDLLDYLQNHKTLSGIQRVQVGIVEYALREIGKTGKPYVFVRTGKNASGFWSVDPANLLAVIRYVSQPVVSQDRLLSLVRAADQHALRVEPGPGQIYFILGAFWGFGANAARYVSLKTAGVLVGVYIYDLIPVTHPEYCAADLVSEFSFALADGFQSFDFILAISDFVANEVKQFLKRYGLRQVPVFAIPLAHQLLDRFPSAADPIWTDSIAVLRNRPFVLMVSTIEARKNHLYLYSIWKELISEGLDPPDLVFVGRFGWRVNDLRDMLQSTQFLGRRIHVLHDLSDTDLETLYQSCLFTAFPSFIEGWGLPVGESLAHGRPCIASSTSSIPEVGGDLVDYVDPLNVRHGIDVFRRMIRDTAYREGREKDIKARFRARTWNDVGRDLAARFDALRPMRANPYRPPVLAAGELLIPGDMTIGKAVPEGYWSRPLRTIFAKSWYPVEPFGCWLRGREGFLWFASDCAPGTRVSLYMSLIGAPWSDGCDVTVQTGKGGKRHTTEAVFPKTLQQDLVTFPVNSEKAFLCRVEGQVEQDGTIHVSLFVNGQADGQNVAKSTSDGRTFYLGICKLAYASSMDPQLRIDLFEHFSTSRM